MNKTAAVSVLAIIISLASIAINIGTSTLNRGRSDESYIVRIANAELLHLEADGALTRPYSRDVAQTELLKLWTTGIYDGPHGSNYYNLEKLDKDHVEARFVMIAHCEFDQSACRFE